MSARLGRARHRGPGQADAGMVTAELAAALPALVFVVVAAVGAVIAVTDELRCTDAASTAARLAARGDSPEAVRAAALRVAPHGATVRMTSTATTVTATVVMKVGGPGWFGRLPRLTITQHSVAGREDVAEP